MIKCTHCKKPIPEPGGVILNIDGDFVCDEKCKADYSKEMDRFCTEILPHEDKFLAWMGGADL